MTDIPAAEHALIDLAAAMRYWDRRETADAILAAKQAGWELDRIANRIVRLLTQPDGEGTPADLLIAARNPLKPVQGGPGPGTFQRGLATAREALEHRRDGTGETA